MNRVFQISSILILSAIAALLFQYSQNGHYQFSTNGTSGVIVDTRTGEYWTEDGSHFEPRSAHITAHHPSVDDQTSSDDRSNKFRDCLQDAVAHHKSAKDCLDQKYSSFQGQASPDNTLSSQPDKMK